MLNNNHYLAWIIVIIFVTRLGGMEARTIWSRSWITSYSKISTKQPTAMEMTHNNTINRIRGGSYDFHNSTYYDQYGKRIDDNDLNPQLSVRDSPTSTLNESFINHSISESFSSFTPTPSVVDTMTLIKYKRLIEQYWSLIQTKINEIPLNQLFFNSSDLQELLSTNSMPIGPLRSFIESFTHAIYLDIVGHVIYDYARYRTTLNDTHHYHHNGNDSHMTYYTKLFSKNNTFDDDCYRYILQRRIKIAQYLYHPLLVYSDSMTILHLLQQSSNIPSYPTSSLPDIVSSLDNIDQDNQAKESSKYLHNLMSIGFVRKMLLVSTMMMKDSRQYFTVYFHYLQSIINIKEFIITTLPPSLQFIGQKNLQQRIRLFLNDIAYEVMGKVPLTDEEIVFDDSALILCLELEEVLNKGLSKSSTLWKRMQNKIKMKLQQQSKTKLMDTKDKEDADDEDYVGWLDDEWTMAVTVLQRMLLLYHEDTLQRVEYMRKKMTEFNYQPIMYRDIKRQAYRLSLTNITMQWRNHIDERVTNNYTIFDQIDEMANYYTNSGNTSIQIILNTNNSDSDSNVYCMIASRDIEENEEYYCETAMCGVTSFMGDSRYCATCGKRLLSNRNKKKPIECRYCHDRYCSKHCQQQYDALHTLQCHTGWKQFIKSLNLNNSSTSLLTFMVVIAIEWIMILEVYGRQDASYYFIHDSFAYTHSDNEIKQLNNMKYTNVYPLKQLPNGEMILNIMKLFYQYCPNLLKYHTICDVFDVIAWLLPNVICMQLYDDTTDTHVIDKSSNHTSNHIVSSFPFRVAMMHSLASFVNHDCNPNTNYYYDRNKLMIHFIANRRIAKGEEITITYVPDILDPMERKIALRNRWGFDCKCKLCLQVNKNE